MRRCLFCGSFVEGNCKCEEQMMNQDHQEQMESDFVGFSDQEVFDSDMDYFFDLAFEKANGDVKAKTMLSSIFACCGGR